MAFILSLDCSTKSTGWAIYNSKKQLIDYGCITASSTDLIKRINKMVHGLDEVCKKYKDINTIVMEEVRPDIGHTSNPKTWKALMWLQAANNFYIHSQLKNTKIVYLYPSEWRRICGIKNGRGIKRTAAKEMDIKFVKEKFNITVNDDIADAIGIGYAYLYPTEVKELNWE
jgi:Holliday junction resolvasome RuvABC endonuclease subunit